MTAAAKTVTEELRDAIALLGDTVVFAELREHLSIEVAAGTSRAAVSQAKDVLTMMDGIEAASAAIERAMNLIQHARCNALAALDRF